jgi:predicted GTPase
LEWTPPYDWQNPTSTKEHNIRAAVEHHRAMFGDRLAGVVPVCSDVQRHRASGIEEHLLPAMLAVLGEARACCLLRTLHDESNRGQVFRLVQQLCRSGAELLRPHLPS